MNFMILSVTAVLVAVFIIYWHFKFKFVFPLESRLFLIEGNLSKFDGFVKDIMEHSYVPDSMEHYSELVENCLIRLHKIFPDACIFTFEAVNENWKLINCLNDFGDRFAIMSDYRWDVFDRAAKTSETVVVENFEYDSANILVKFFKSLNLKYAAACPFGALEKSSRWIFVFASPKAPDYDRLRPFLGFLISHFNSLYAFSSRVVHIVKENTQMKDELGAVLHELDMAGTKLIQRAKERKALYEVVTAVTGEHRDRKIGCAAVLNIVAKIAEADVVACLLVDETKAELAVQPGAYGIQKDESAYYRVPLSDTASSSVRTFLTGKPFISGNAQDDPDVIRKYACLWNINSLMVVPISLYDKTIGVLRVGSAKPNFFTNEQLEFLNIIADELAIIIEIFRLYDNLSKTAEELAQLNKIKDDFLSTVSHELKTPLTTIKGFVSVILSGEVGQINEQQSNFLNIVDQAVNRLNNLISDLLDLSRLSGKVEMEFKMTDMKEVIKHSLDNMSFKAREKSIKISASFDEDILPVHADPRWITQVIDNLLVNAVKFSKAGSSIDVTAHNKGDVVVVGVIDNGPGIPHNEQKFIFEKFYRGKNNAGLVPGTGLGLAISKSVIEKHNGKIWVESKMGEGSRFYFAIPAAKTRKNESRVTSQES
ncbi:MAG: GAF domain-containing sensor histidine kinase [Elusimicrobia bacterium]|nr:GAF domain-containing sensor histidine kinase [Elusimicrobiota bacterium]